MLYGWGNQLLQSVLRRYKCVSVAIQRTGMTVVGLADTRLALTTVALSFSPFQTNVTKCSQSSAGQQIGIESADG